MVLAVQISAASGFSQASVTGALALREAGLAAPADRGAPDDAARPGPPVARLDLRSQTQAQRREDEPDTPDPQSASAEEKPETNARNAKIDEQGLTEADRRKVEQLQRRDREVREHERAHKTAGGSITGSARFDFTRGPDGKQYAVGGEVSIDASPVPGKPDATIRKMEVVKRAALAPRNPSGQDRSVAARADAEIIKAKQELAELRREEQTGRSQAEPGQTAAQGDAIGQTDPLFDPSIRFTSAVGGASLPLGTGLAGGGELDINAGLTTPGSLFSLVA